MNQRSFQFRGLAVLLALVLFVPGWAATPTVAPQLPDPGSVGMTKEQQVLAAPTRISPAATTEQEQH